MPTTREMMKASSNSYSAHFLLLLILQFISRISAIRTRLRCVFSGPSVSLLSRNRGEILLGCNLYSRCCNSYEYCVSCCLDPSRTQSVEVMKVKIAKPSSAGTYASVFDFCAGRCRHNSESVIHENAYISEFHHCFSILSNSSGGTDKHTETGLAGISVIVGRQGESCDSVCKSIGQSCVPNKLLLLNQCEIMQKYMSCKGACLASVGTDQPAEVVDDAPRHLNPGACLYTQTQSLLSCAGSHRHTRRLCPCA